MKENTRKLMWFRYQETLSNLIDESLWLWGISWHKQNFWHFLNHTHNTCISLHHNSNIIITELSLLPGRGHLLVGVQFFGCFDGGHFFSRVQRGELFWICESHSLKENTFQMRCKSHLKPFRLISNFSEWRGASFLSGPKGQQGVQNFFSDRHPPAGKKMWAP